MRESTENLTTPSFWDEYNKVTELWTYCHTIKLHNLQVLIQNFVFYKEEMNRMETG